MSPDVTSLLGAISYAADQHRLQRRKGPADGPNNRQTPYLNHLIRVAELIANAGMTDVDVLRAAILHDVVEDTPATEADVRERFGDRVADFVMEVSDDKSLPKERRKALPVAHAAHISPAAAWIKLADKIDNVRDITIAPPVGWSLERIREYFEWAKRVTDALPPTSPALQDYFDALFAQKP